MVFYLNLCCYNRWDSCTHISNLPMQFLGVVVPRSVTYPRSFWDSCTHIRNVPMQFSGVPFWLPWVEFVGARLLQTVFPDKNSVEIALKTSDLFLLFTFETQIFVLRKGNISKLSHKESSPCLCVLPEAYLEPSRTSTIELFCKKIKCWIWLTLVFFSLKWVQHQCSFFSKVERKCFWK